VPERLVGEGIDTQNIKSIETKMKKIFKRIFKITFLAFLAAILTIAIIVLFPQYLFANKMGYKNFTVYSNNNIDNNIKTVLDNAMILVEKSELYDSNYRYNVILCYNTFYNKIDDELLGNSPTARTTLSNIVIKVKINAEKNLAFPTFRKACEINLTELLAHEMTHCLQANKYGILKFNPFKHPEFWKLEGYPEYISKQAELSSKDYSLEKDIDTYVRGKNAKNGRWIKESGCEVPDYYYKGKLLLQYLMDIEHLSYDQILRDTASENTVYEEMIKWRDNIKDLKN
jgi:hypothetical protein